MTAPAPGWTPASAARRAREVLREQGPSGVLYGVLAHAGYRRLWIFVLDLASPPPVSRMPGWIDVAELTEEGLDEYLAFRPRTTRTAALERLRGGHRCFLARAEGLPVATQWAAVRRLPGEWLGADLDLAEGEACSYDSYTAPNVRGLGIGPALRVAMARALRDGGQRWLLATILPENRPAVRLVEKLGYERIGTVHSGRIGERRRTWFRMEPGRRPPGRATAQLHQSAARSLIAVAAWRAHPARPLRALSLLAETQWWSADRIRELQLEALRQTLAEAERIPLYRERIAEAGLRVDTLSSLEELAALPALEPGQLSTGVRAGRRVSTSGTTGAPRRMVWPLETMRWADAAEYRAREWLGVRAVDSRVWICCNEASRFRRASLALFNTRLLDARSFADSRFAHRVAALVEQSPPAVLQGVSNALYDLARAADANGRRLRPGVCWSAANHLLPQYRATMESVFGAPVFERYAAVETGLIASHCGEGGLHVQAENLIVEIVDAQGGPARPGKLGTVLVTTLRNPSMPLLRYKIGDLAVAGPAEPCACGRGLPLITSVAGRSTDQLRRSDGRTIDPREVFALMLRVAPRAVDFQIRQGQDLAVEANIVAAGDAPDRGEASRLEQALNELVGVGEATQVSYVDRVPLASSGKLRHVVGVEDDPSS